MKPEDPTTAHLKQLRAARRLPRLLYLIYPSMSPLEVYATRFEGGRCATGCASYTQRAQPMFMRD